MERETVQRGKHGNEEEVLNRGGVRKCRGATKLRRLKITKLHLVRKFKQLKTQTLRSNREASEARMTSMRSNKRFKSGD